MASSGLTKIHFHYTKNGLDSKGKSIESSHPLDPSEICHFSLIHTHRDQHLIIYGANLRWLRSWENKLFDAIFPLKNLEFIVSV